MHKATASLLATRGVQCVPPSFSGKCEAAVHLRVSDAPAKRGRAYAGSRFVPLPSESRHITSMRMPPPLHRHLATMSTSWNWRKLPISLTELCIDTTLRCGQSFRWRKSEDDIWSCALRGRLISLKQDPTHLYYSVQWPATRSAPLTPPSSVPGAPDHSDEDDTEDFLRHYLNLEPNLGQLYEQWSAADTNFKKKAPKFTGVRILKQDAWEATVGFICSSNNNIARISQMMEALCVNYGSAVGSVGGKTFYDMPTPEALNDSKVEAHLRDLKFGYRAKYLYNTASLVAEHPKGWLDSLRNPESPAFGGKPATAGPMLPEGRTGYRDAHEQLLSLQGVGPKVADCVCLMGLGWGEAVPVDTHVWQIAVRDYKFGRGKQSSLTKATYDAVGNHFRELWGSEAGWAHSVLFTADLRAFSDRLKAKVEVKEEVVKIEGVEAVKVKEEAIETEQVRKVHVKKETLIGVNEVKVEEVTSATKRGRGSKRSASAADIALAGRSTRSKRSRGS